MIATYTVTAAVFVYVVGAGLDALSVRLHVPYRVRIER